MKKITAKIIAAVMAVLMLTSVAGCSLLEGEPVKYDIGNGLSIVLPEGMQEVEMEGIYKTLINLNIGATFVCETADELAAVGFEDITLEDYAKLSEQAYSLETPYTADANGNLVTTYTTDVDGTDMFYYVTLREGNGCFWTINFFCEDSAKAEYSTKFAEWSASIVIE